MHRDLTVRENLFFSALLRTPHKIFNVPSLIEKLKLKKCADSIIGDELVRGISGGERKRVNIGIEMINSSKILILDEPTSGI
jgi:ATP-binding cassette, subfamily G (WHITE), member 2